MRRWGVCRSLANRDNQRGAADRFLQHEIDTGGTAMLALGQSGGAGNGQDRHARTIIGFRSADGPRGLCHVHGSFSLPERTQIFLSYCLPSVRLNR